MGPLPNWALELAAQFADCGVGTGFDQLIVNEHEPGQGIAAHIDCVPCFGPTVLSLSIGSVCVMEFVHHETHQKRYDQWKANLAAGGFP